MNKVIIYLLVITILSATTVSSVEAVAFPAGNTQKADNDNTEKNKDKEDKKDLSVEEEQNNVGSPLPVVQVTLPPVLPTAKPTESPKVTQPVQQNRTTEPEKQNTKIIPNTTKSDTIVVPLNRDADRSTVNQISTPKIQNQPNTPVNTTKNTTQNAIQESKSAAPLNSKIVPPEVPSGVQVKGVDYYNTNQLTPAATRSLSLVSLALFVLGITMVKSPMLMRNLTNHRKVKNIAVREKDPNGFAIPYYNFKTHASR